MILPPILTMPAFGPASAGAAPLPVLAAAAVLCGLGRRVAGGVLNQWFAPKSRVMGDLPARCIWGGTLALAAGCSGALVWQAFAIVPLVVIGCAVPMWAIDPLATGYRTPRWLRCVGLLAHGVLSMLLLTLAAWWCGYQWGWLLAASAAILPLYAFGWVIAPRLSLPIGARAGSEIGEWLFGLTMGVAVIGAIAGG